jgi:anti-sigma B factor antagonist
LTASDIPTEPHAPSYGLRLTRADKSDDAVVRVVGELDLANVTFVRNELERALATGRERIVVDLRALEFLDSTGIHALVQAHDRCRADGRSMTVLLVPGPVHRTLDVSGALQVLDHVPLEAVAA